MDAQAQSAIRFALTAAGAWLTTRGTIDQAAWEQFSGIAMAIISFAWSQWHHVQIKKNNEN